MLRLPLVQLGVGAAAAAARPAVAEAASHGSGAIALRTRYLALQCCTPPDLCEGPCVLDQRRFSQSWPSEVAAGSRAAANLRHCIRGEAARGMQYHGRALGPPLRLRLAVWEVPSRTGFVKTWATAWRGSRITEVHSRTQGAPTPFRSRGAHGGDTTPGLNGVDLPVAAARPPPPPPAAVAPKRSARAAAARPVQYVSESDGSK